MTMATDAGTYLATMVLNEQRAVSNLSLDISTRLTFRIGYLSSIESYPEDTPQPRKEVHLPEPDSDT